MKITELPDYKTAVFASLSGDLNEAKQAYERLLDQVEANDDIVAISFFMQSLANIEARMGNLELGHELHLRAIGQSFGIPLNLIAYAKGLAEHFDAPELALQKLQEAETLLASDKWNRKADGIAPEAYRSQIAELREMIDAD